MCGIAGILKINSPTTPEDIAAVQRMMDAQIHRGPNGEGIIALGTPSPLTPHSSRSSAVLGHRRLSIIDLSEAGKQPMSNEEVTVWVSYNGEIYNFRELRDELTAKGHTFKSQTDTEVLVHGYEEWSIEGLLARLRGMFAFALYDASNLQHLASRLFLARDRFGIKPLYYHQNNEQIIFSSEVRAIMKTGMIPDETNVEALVRFLQLGSVPVPSTTIKNVCALPAGHYLVVDEQGVNLKPYWDLSTYLHQSQPVSTNLDDCIKTTRSLLEDSVNLHLTSDVPLGVFLSGGIDSSSLVALASRFRDKPFTTLSIIFEEPDYNEAEYARLAAKKYGTDHREVLLRRKDFFEALHRIFAAMDQPTIDGINTYFVSKAAKEAGLTVVLSGTGGDEVFLGYDHFKKTTILERAHRLLDILPLWMRKGLIRMAVRLGAMAGRHGLERLAYLENPSDANAYLLFRGLFAPHQIQDLLGIAEREFKSFDSATKSPNLLISKLSDLPISQSPDSPISQSPNLLQSLTLLEFNYYLQNQLLKDTDFMSMAHSIETRVPYLDHRLVEYVAGIPDTEKLSNGMNKPLLVKALGNDIPREIWHRPKMGFTFPFGDWMKEQAQDLQARSLEQKFLDQKTVECVWKGFQEGRVHWSRAWALVVASQLFSS